MNGIEPRFRGLFEQIENHKNSFSVPNKTFESTRWTNFLEGIFVDQLEALSRTHEPEYIGQYVIEYFCSLIDEESLEL